MTNLSPMPMSDLTAETTLSIRAHYASGRFDLDTALTRIANGGTRTLPREQAADILRQPITVDQVKTLTGKSGETATEESVAARLAEVTA